MKDSVFGVRTLTVSAMLIAIGVVLSFLRIPLSTITEVTLTGLPIAVGGFLFGPVVGFMIGALIDVCGFLVKPAGPFFPGFTLSTGLIGMIYGLFLYRKWWDKPRGAAGGFDINVGSGSAGRNEGSGGAGLLRDGSKGLVIRIAIAHLVKTVLISLLLNCIWLSVFYGMPFKAVFIGSVPKEAINFPIEVFLIYSILLLLKSYLKNNDI